MTEPVRRAWLIAEGRCVECSQPRGDSPVATRCAACAVKHRAAQDALRRKKRLEDPWHDITEGDPFPMGGAAPRLQSVALLRIRLDSAALRGIDTLKKTERQRCLAAGERYIGYQLSRLIREAIQTFATRDFAIFPHLFNTELAVTFHCDAPTLAIIDYHARRRFDGNRAATVRAMLAALAAPPARNDEDDFQSPFDDPRFYEKKRQQSRREAAQAETIQREADKNRNQPRKNFWEYSPVYKDNKVIGERKREESE